MHREQTFLPSSKAINIPSEFPVKVMNQAMRVPDHVQEADRDGRRI